MALEVVLLDQVPTVQMARRVVLSSGRWPGHAVLGRSAGMCHILVPYLLYLELPLARRIQHENLWRQELGYWHGGHRFLHLFRAKASFHLPVRCIVVVYQI